MSLLTTSDVVKNNEMRRARTSTKEYNSSSNATVQENLARKAAAAAAAGTKVNTEIIKGADGSKIFNPYLQQINKKHNGCSKLYNVDKQNVVFLKLQLNNLRNKNCQHHQLQQQQQQQHY